MDRIADLRARAVRMPRAHAVLQLAYAVFFAGYIGVFAFAGSAEGGAQAFGGMTATLILPPVIISSALVSGANERFGRRVLLARADWIAVILFALSFVGTVAWGIVSESSAGTVGGYPWWVALVLALMALVAFGVRPLIVILRTAAESDGRTKGRAIALSLPVRLTTAFLGVFFGLVCAVVFVPAIGWLVILLGMIIVVIALAVRHEPWGFANVGYEWRFPQWIAFGIASTIMFLLSVLIVATDAITPGIAAGAGALVAASLILSAFLPGPRRGASAA
ncbi:hypothetical protein OED01_12630 [Microbacterium sp. M28]|uniref:hypothetical protein n=1 Tax=Microbacterium sp. M28 TaxID=2962064 RepID=UPI0021F4CE68|nr:hypothetical protein [Microbacterium sp. M28]UYO96440.1 hypothetical protein OED01_12630 [Microbacterium sp. M28]